MHNIATVSGTYNRLGALQRMMQSVRAQIPPGLSHRFYIVDGGSSDGTLDYLRTQPDVTLIEHGELRGAIRAFCDGAKAAEADYVILANDDITFGPDSIVRAFTHLESHPTCGAVAFADDRPAPGYGDGLKVQTITAIEPSGKHVSVPYPQVGMVRKWLGDLVGWWGVDDPVMSAGHTYGGDSYLGARIWEQGYSVDSLKGVYILDGLAQDALRSRNYDIEQQNPGMYYKRFAKPPRIAPQPTPDNPQSERLRILYLPIYEPYNTAQRSNKRGLRLELAKRGLVYELDYLSVACDLPGLVEVWQPHLMLTQLHSADIVTAEALVEARKRKPDMVAVNWCGDAHIHGLTSEPMLRLLRHVDLQLVVNAHVLPVYEAWGIRAAYWQIGYEEPLGALPDVPAHDILFLGNMNAKNRQLLETTLTAEAASSRVNLGLYGHGWKEPAGSTLYDFAAGEALYHKCKVAVGDQFWGQTYAFVSNRFFQALVAGAFMLQEASPGLDEYCGLIDGVHYVSWKGLDDLQLKIRYWLSPKRETKRRQIAEAGRAFVRANFSFERQVEKLFNDLLPMIQAPMIRTESEAVR